MVRLEDIKPGMKVKIVDQWPSGSDHVHAMDCWLGEIMTVVKTSNISNNRRIWMREDFGDNQRHPFRRWFWQECMIDCIVDDQEAKARSAPDDPEEFLFILTM